MFHLTEVKENLQQCNNDADRLIAQLHDIEVTMRELSGELEEKIKAYDTLQHEHQSMFYAGRVPSHSPLWYATVSNLQMLTRFN